MVEVKTAIKQRRKLLRALKRSREAGLDTADVLEQFQKAKAAAKKAVKQAKERSWEDFVVKISPSSTTAEMWQTMRESYPPLFQAAKEREERDRVGSLPNTNDIYNSDFTLEELLWVLDKGRSVSTGPDSAIVTPIPKSSKPTSPKDFRPISVLPAVSKVLEKILLSQITDHLDVSTPALLAKHQSGYRKNHSTTTDQVKRSQVVDLGGTPSNPRNLTDGTPQRSCLSILLFSLYISSLPGVLKCEYHLYADDLQIYISGPASEINRLIEAINQDLLAIERWATENRLFPNPKKTQAIVFCRDGAIIPQNDIRFCDETITLSNKVTNLGPIIDSNLKWTDQINEVTKKIYNTLRTFRRFLGMLSRQIRMKLVQAVVMPFFAYCDVVYYPGLSTALKAQLHRCFKSSVKFVYEIRGRDTTREVRHTILGCDLPENYHRRICCFMYGAYHRSLPEYIRQYTPEGRNKRARSFVPPHHTTSSRKSVLIFGASTWNALPLATRQQRTLTSLKAALHRAD
ncbi:uncharacterized protein LOC135710442 [Ochlerotatus camptorhynchus]|uniref:uncharacterized protein LOC135710442 n=1 Tax=Ochlerotatus camptorhynchus TaxID=644619 RepID=UPI0031DE1329